MNWPLAFALASIPIAMAVATIWQGPEPESPKVACIKQHAQWTDGYGRAGWSGTCVFPAKGQ